MVAFIDLKSQFNKIESPIRQAIDNVLEHGQFIMGPEVFELERRIQDYCNVKHVISCSSGTDALLMGLMAKNIGPGDAVFTTPFTFFATVEMIILTGATPVFIDIEPSTYNIDVKKIEQAIVKIKQQGELTPRGIIPVDLFGQPVEYDQIIDIAAAHDLFVFSDAAQSFGSSYKGKKIGGLCDMTATSFYPAKPLGAYGDAGAIMTNDDEVAEVLKSIRIHGQIPEDKYINQRIGLAARMDTIQAAILIEKLNILDEEIQSRNHIAKSYNELLNKHVGIPYVREDRISAWAQYSILVRDPMLVAERLKEHQYPTARFYPLTMHLQPALKGKYNKGDFPVAEDTSAKIISLPMHPYLENSHIQQIAEIITSLD